MTALELDETTSLHRAQSLAHRHVAHFELLAQRADGDSAPRCQLARQDTAQHLVGHLIHDRTGSSAVHPVHRCTHCLSIYDENIDFAESGSVAPNAAARTSITDVRVSLRPILRRSSPR